MDNQFSILGHDYRMRDPKVYGADVRIQQTRKAYFTRTEGGRFHDQLYQQVKDHTGRYKDLEALYDQGQHDLLDEEISFRQEPKHIVRLRYEAWMAEQVEDTSLDDILTLCALLEPVGDAPVLIPEALLNAPTAQIRQEIQAPLRFFFEARTASKPESKPSNLPSETTTEATVPTETISMPESTSP